MSPIIMVTLVAVTGILYFTGGLKATVADSAKSEDLEPPPALAEKWEQENNLVLAHQMGQSLCKMLSQFRLEDAMRAEGDNQVFENRRASPQDTLYDGIEKNHSALVGRVESLEKSIQLLAKALVDARIKLPICNSAEEVIPECIRVPNVSRTAGGTTIPPSPQRQNEEPQYLEDIRKRRCGGLVKVYDEDELVHKLPNKFPDGYTEGCVWVVWALQGGPIKIKLLPHSEAQFHSNFTVRILNQHKDRGYNSTSLSMNQQVTLFTNGSFEGNPGYYPYVLVYFYGMPTKPGQGLHLKFWSGNSGFGMKEIKPRVFILPEDPSGTGKFRYPIAPRISYGKSERVFVIVQAIYGKKLKIYIHGVKWKSIDGAGEWFQLSWLKADRPHDPKVIRRSFHYPRKDVKVSLKSGSPILLVFKSVELPSSAPNFTGFHIQYSYHDE